VPVPLSDDRILDNPGGLVLGRAARPGAMSQSGRIRPGRPVQGGTPSKLWSTKVCIRAVTWPRRYRGGVEGWG
jgi:hypothetical protein